MTVDAASEETPAWPYVLGGTLVAAALIGGTVAFNRNRRTAAAGIEVDKAITILKPASELFSFWRRFENLPLFMKHLESVQETGNRSHWVACAPTGTTVEWDAEIVDEQQDRVIRWRSLPDAVVPHEGLVCFEELPHGRGTVVDVSIRYSPPGEKTTSLIAKLFGEEPSMQISEDLRRFKQLMEVGEVIRAKPQPVGS